MVAMVLHRCKSQSVISSDDIELFRKIRPRVNPLPCGKSQNQQSSQTEFCVTNEGLKPHHGRKFVIPQCETANWINVSIALLWHPDSPSGIVNAMKLGIRSVHVGYMSVENISYVDSP